MPFRRRQKIPTENVSLCARTFWQATQAFDKQHFIHDTYQASNQHHIRREYSLSCAKMASSAPFINYYEVLSLESGADEAAVRKAYRRKALELHPDKNRDNPRAGELLQSCVTTEQTADACRRHGRTRRSLQCALQVAVQTGTGSPGFPCRQASFVPPPPMNCHCYYIHVHRRTVCVRWCANRAGNMITVLFGSACSMDYSLRITP